MNLIVLILFILLQASCLWSSSPFRGRCKREAIFKKTSDKALSNHVVDTLNVATDTHCAFACLQHSNCVSYNFQQAYSPTKKCELNDQTKTSKPADYVSRPGYGYYDAKDFVVSVCKGSPCKNNAKCVDECTDDYLCQCLGGYVGKNCETWIGLNGTKAAFAAKSCRHIKVMINPRAPDGKYWINPTNTGSPFQVTCDMTTDGGGWLLVKHVKIQSLPPSTNIDSQTDYRKLGAMNNWMVLREAALKSLKSDMGFSQIRYYCKKKKVGRVLHVMTKLSQLGYDAVRYLAITDSPFPTACNSFTRLPDDTSKLSRNCRKWGYNKGATEGNHWGHSGNTGSERMYNLMIFWHGKYQVRMKGTYQCDDRENDNHSKGDTYKMFVR